jgi:hypothetical protein
MPPYIRRFRGWDWFTPRAIQHLPWQEQERLTQEAWEAVHRHPRYQLVTRPLPWLNIFLMGLMALDQLLLKTSSLIYLLIVLTLLAQSVGLGIWRRRLFRKALRQKLLDAGICPRICFGCGYNLEGYEGKACPACDVLLLPQPNSPN